MRLPGENRGASRQQNKILFHLISTVLEAESIHRGDAEKQLSYTEKTFPFTLPRYFT
jgi:hypothetical protein